MKKFLIVEMSGNVIVNIGVFSASSRKEAEKKYSHGPDRKMGQLNIYETEKLNGKYLDPHSAELTAKAKKCLEKCHGNCRATWTEYKKKSSHMCHYCQEFKDQSGFPRIRTFR